MLAAPASRRLRTGRPDVTIDVLQDDVLLEIFDFYRNCVVRFDGMWDWQLLLHVCRRWRYIVLASPRRLDLQIKCNRSTPARKLLDIWPPFPIFISCDSWGEDLENDDILAALQRRNRISEIDFWCGYWWEMEQFASAIGGPFPVLTHLTVHVSQTQSLMVASDSVTEKLPDSFLGGSAPLLESLVLERAPFPALPNLVLSASHFLFLHLYHIPHVGYIPPEAMVTFLLPLHNLEGLTIEFTSPKSRPLQMSPPPSTRALLPSLNHFHFDGASEYLVDFIARIDAPMLQRFSMIFFSDIIPNISELHKFIDRTDGIKIFTRAEVHMDHEEVQVIFESPNPGLDIICDSSASPLASMVRLLEQLLTIPSQAEQLELHEFGIEEEWQDEVDDSQWLQLLRPFVSVKSLYVSEGLGPFIASALEELTEERVADVLPKLDSLFLQGLGSSEPVEETIKSFVSTRQLSGHPVILRHWVNKRIY